MLLRIVENKMRNRKKRDIKSLNLQGCHHLDLSPFAVEVAVGKVGIAGCKPLVTWPPTFWLFFDRRFQGLAQGICQQVNWHAQRPKKNRRSLWISLWLNSGKTRLGAVAIGLAATLDGLLQAFIHRGTMTEQFRSS